MKVFQLIGTHPRVLLVISFRAARKSSIGQGQYLYSLAEGPNATTA